MRVKRIIKQALYQTYQKYANGPADVYAASCLREVPLKEYEALLEEMLDKKLITQSGELDYYMVTHVGEMVGTGSTCTCRECRPQDYR